MHMRSENGSTSTLQSTQHLLTTVAKEASNSQCVEYNQKYVRCIQHTFENKLFGDSDTAKGEENKISMRLTHFLLTAAIF